MFKKSLLFAVCAFWCSAAQANVITNGGFETGDFTGWTVIDNGGTDGCGSNVWTVNSTGDQGCTGNVGLAPAPTSGTYAAYNTFDGQGGAPFMLSQQVNLPTGILYANLSFMDTFLLTYSGDLRTFSVDLYDSANAVLLTNIFSVSPGYDASQGWTPESIDLTSALASLGGDTVTLRFSNIIPQSYTGPANFGLDNISLDIRTAEVPEPASLALIGAGLLGLGLARRRRKA